MLPMDRLFFKLTAYVYLGMWFSDVADIMQLSHLFLIFNGIVN